MTDIIFYTSELTPPVEAKLAGVYSFAREHGWRVRPVALARSGRHPADFIRLWKPAGVLVECADMKTLPEAREFGRLPVVWIDRDPSVSGGLTAALDISRSVDLAAAELRQDGIASYAYVGWHKPIWWSAIREERFTALFPGARVAPRDAWGPKTYAGEDLKLRKFLRALPKPTAIFAANDLTAERVISAAALENLTIPDDMTVLGADDDTFLCENSEPSVSSVIPDFPSLGRLGAELLFKRLQDPKFRTARAYAQPRGVARRTSTRRMSVRDGEVMKALTLIRAKACEGLSVADVCTVLACSRRSAETRFRAATGHSILDEIHEVRLERVFALLANPDQAIEPIANLCGWQSPVSLKRLFKRKTGQTMRAWRTGP